MPQEWMDVSHLSFLTVLLLEQVQLSWFPGWLAEDRLAIALKANPVVEWYLRHKCPQLKDWLDRVMATAQTVADPIAIRQAETDVLASMADLVVYAVDPTVYDALPFLNWDSNELLCLADFSGKTVIDVGAGTGRLALSVASMAATVFAVEPIGNLRSYLKQKSLNQGFRNVYPVDGLITSIPFSDHFSDITMGGHFFGASPEAEYKELCRVTKPGGMMILCPGNSDQDNDVHNFLVAQGFDWSRFEEPQDGWKRKYWKKCA
jgi:SAM-dependent methyltransferase